MLPTGDGLTVGIVADLVHGGDLGVAGESADPSDAGIWRIPLAAFRDSGAQPYRIATLPASSFPDGMAFDPQGNLDIADSTLSGRSGASHWILDADHLIVEPLFTPTGASFEGLTLSGKPSPGE